jgi:hypothetical protein
MRANAVGNRGSGWNERGASFARTTSTTKISQPRSLRLALCPSASYLHMRCLTRTKVNEGMQRMIGMKRCPESSKSHVTIFLTAHVQRKRGREIHGVLNIPQPSKVWYCTVWETRPDYRMGSRSKGGHKGGLARRRKGIISQRSFLASYGYGTVLGMPRGFCRSGQVPPRWNQILTVQHRAWRSYRMNCVAGRPFPPSAP